MRTGCARGTHVERGRSAVVVYRGGGRGGSDEPEPEPGEEKTRAALDDVQREREPVRVGRECELGVVRARVCGP